MSEDWQTKYGTRRVRRDPPTLEEAIFAAAGITEDWAGAGEEAGTCAGAPADNIVAAPKPIAASVNFVALTKTPSNSNFRNLAQLIPD